MDTQNRLHSIKNLGSYSNEKHICHTCQEVIDSEISRVILMRNVDRAPRLFFFHFFVPCWDFKALCKKYPNLTLDLAGFSIPNNISLEEKTLRDMQKNIQLWT